MHGGTNGKISVRLIAEYFSFEHKNTPFLKLIAQRKEEGG